MKWNKIYNKFIVCLSHCKNALFFFGPLNPPWEWLFPIWQSVGKCWTLLPTGLHRLVKSRCLLQNLYLLTMCLHHELYQPLFYSAKQLSSVDPTASQLCTVQLIAVIGITTDILQCRDSAVMIMGLGSSAIGKFLLDGSLESK